MGTVVADNSLAATYLPLMVELENGSTEFFTLDGKLSVAHTVPFLIFISREETSLKTFYAVVRKDELKKLPTRKVYASILSEDETLPAENDPELTVIKFAVEV